MSFIKKIAVSIIITMASCTISIFSSATDMEEPDNQRNCSKINHHESDANSKKIGRNRADLIIGKTEMSDQLIIGGADLGLLGLNFIKAYQSLSPLELTLGLIGGYLTADLASGITHMTLDNIDPNFGPQQLRVIAQDFQNHHKDPWRMKVDSFWFQNIEVYGVALVTFTTSLMMSYLGYDLSAYLMTTTMGWNMLTQLAHACAHGKLRGNKVIEFLQNNGIIMSPKHHSKHHTPPYDKNFCILAGHMEPVAQFIYSTAKRAINLGKSFFTQAEGEHVSQ